ncbi:helix-turn-helix transcriptional regulator [Caballeronia novacaledonica]|uniref:helix-turn-helix domain-containing protein n=1 Tax=Caballeronia novacaledonica TaxID=1544861 RepID=UPI001EE21D5E|nr:AraC family transcriptional regulator [Caballeronia novacaledonica]GJH14182.1 helix-turn-helix transcriptional regulator [Caballeronia novacaledonica]
MESHQAFGDEIANIFRLTKAPSVSTVIRPGAFFAATHMQCGEEGLGKTLPIPVQPAYIVCILYRPLVHELWLAGKPVPLGPLPLGTISAVSLEQEPTAYYGGRLDSLQLYVPRNSLNAMADHEGMPALRELVIPNGTVDPVAYQLSVLMRPAIERPEQANLLFLSGLMEAFYGHLCGRYGDMSSKVTRLKGGLSPRDLTRAKELIDANLSGAVSLAALGRECGMSPNHFSRAFKQSTGVPPHRWLLLRRVELAMGLIERGEMSMSEVAIVTGFADQSHLIRVFSQIVGATPKAWKDSRLAR